MQLKDAFDADDICLFDELLTSGADINYRYNDGYGEYTLYQRVKNYDTSLMYQYFWTRNDCNEIEKIRKEEKLIADRKTN